MIAESSIRSANPVVLDRPIPPSSALYVGTGGDMTVVTEAGEQVTFKNAPGGAWFPIKAALVLSVGTTASNLVAGYL